MRIRSAPFLILPLLFSCIPVELRAQEVDPVQNLSAFARLYGYIRYFHPSDEAAALDWDAFAAYGTTRVKNSRSSEELRETLLELFSPVAPTVQIYEEGEEPPVAPPGLFPEDQTGLEVVAWQHLGVGFGSGNSIYRSVRLNRETRLGGGSGNAVVSRSLDATELLGKGIRLTGVGRSLEAGGRVQLWLRVDLEGGGMGFFDNMMDRPVTDLEWTEMEIRGEVGEDASRILFGALILGGGGAVDHFTLEVQEEDGWTPIPLENGDFEDGDPENPEGWSAPSQGWTYLSVQGDAPSGARYLEVSQEHTTVSGPLFEQAPSLGEVVTRPLGAGLAVQLPLALPSRNGRTLGSPNSTLARALREGLAGVGLAGMTAEDEPLRLGDVVITWNVFQHFYPYHDVVDTGWDEVLETAMERALADRNRDDFQSTLQWMVAQLQDGHGGVYGPSPDPPLAGLPIAVDWIEDQVVVVASDVPDLLGVGDVIDRLDGLPAAQVLEERARTFSGSPQWRRWRALNSFDFGERGTVAVVTLQRGARTLNITVPRDAVQRPSEARPENIEEIEPGVFYVNLDLVEIEAFRARVEDLAQAEGVVFDLRGYPNGNHMALTYLWDEHLQSAHWNVPQIIYPDRAGEPHFAESRWNLPPSEPRFEGKIVFLTDGRAISYAESVMGIVEYYGLGEIVGQATAGANGNVNPFTLPGGWRITWTGMRVVKHDGSQHHMVGIQPTIPTERTLSGVREGRDELLERALEVIRGG
jgi:hypothetical protein